MRINEVFVSGWFTVSKRLSGIVGRAHNLKNRRCFDVKDRKEAIDIPSGVNVNIKDSVV